MNIRMGGGGLQNKSKGKDTQTKQLVPEQASSQTLASLEGTDAPITAAVKKNSQTEALQHRCGGREMSARVFPSSEAGQYSDACCCFTVFEHITKKKKIWAGSTGSFLSPAMANTIVTTDTEVKHKRQAYVIQMCYRQNSRAFKKKKPQQKTKNYLHQLSSIAITYYKHIHHIVNKKRTKTK